MSDPHKEGKDFAEFLKKLSPEERAEGNRKQIEQFEKDYREFQTAFAAGNCFMCGQALSHFDREKPCLHWLLRPAGFTKWHFPAIYNAFGFYQIQSYLRWVANEEARAQNINDLLVEGTGKLFELTISYKEYEWAFSCSENDYKGHQTDSPDSQRPHYHFQMRVNRAAFIRYNDFHVPFSDTDIIEIEAEKAAPEAVKRAFWGGEGMSALLEQDVLEHVVKHGGAAPDPDKAPVKLDTIIMAEEGSTISGDDLAALIKEAKEKRVTVTSIADKLPNVRIQTIVTPGPGVVEQAPRSGGRGKRPPR